MVEMNNIDVSSMTPCWIRHWDPQPTKAILFRRLHALCSTPTSLASLLTTTSRSNGTQHTRHPTSAPAPPAISSSARHTALSPSSLPAVAAVSGGGERGGIDPSQSAEWTATATGVGAPRTVRADRAAPSADPILVTDRTDIRQSAPGYPRWHLPIPSPNTRNRHAICGSPMIVIHTYTYIHTQNTVSTQSHGVIAPAVKYTMSATECTYSSEHSRSPPGRAREQSGRSSHPPSEQPLPHEPAGWVTDPVTRPPPPHPVPPASRSP